MSDDLFESFGDEDLFEEEEELGGEAEGEAQNRTFIIAVAVLGGLLVCALAAFGVWAFVISPRQAAQQPTAEPTVTVAAVEPTEVEPTEVEPTEVVETDTPPPEPTDTPTPVVGPTSTPTPEETAEGAGEPTGVEGGEAGDTPTATPAPRRTPTPRPTSTPRNEVEVGNSGGTGAEEELSQTGLGEWLLGGAALLLIGLAFLARRLRSA